jgi:hypothetical protein
MGSIATQCRLFAGPGPGTRPSRAMPTTDGGVQAAVRGRRNCDGG